MVLVAEGTVLFGEKGEPCLENLAILYHSMAGRLRGQLLHRDLFAVGAASAATTLADTPNTVTQPVSSHHYMEILKIRGPHVDPK